MSVIESNDCCADESRTASEGSNLRLVGKTTYMGERQRGELSMLEFAKGWLKGGECEPACEVG